MSIELSGFGWRHHARRPGGQLDPLDRPLDRLRVAAPQVDVEAGAGKRLVEHIVVATATSLDQRVHRVRLGFGLQPDTGAHHRIIGKYVSQVRKLVGAQVTRAITGVGFG